MQPTVEAVPVSAIPAARKITGVQKLGKESAHQKAPKNHHKNLLQANPIGKPILFRSFGHCDGLAIAEQVH